MRVKIHTTQGEILFSQADWYLKFHEKGNQIIVHRENDKNDVVANFNYNNPNVLGVSGEG